MALQLLGSGVASAVSPIADMHSCGKDFVHARIMATGTFAADLCNSTTLAGQWQDLVYTWHTCQVRR